MPRILAKFQRHHPNGGAKWRWGRFESSDLYHRTTLPLRRSTAATLCSSAMIDGNDAFTVAERYRPTAINNVRSKSITAVVYFNSVCSHGSVPSALAELLVYLSHAGTVYMDRAVEVSMTAEESARRRRCNSESLHYSQNIMFFGIFCNA